MTKLLSSNSFLIIFIILHSANVCKQGFSVSINAIFTDKSKLFSHLTNFTEGTKSPETCQTLTLSSKIKCKNVIQATGRKWPQH